MIRAVPLAHPETSHGTPRIMRYTLGTAAKARRCRQGDDLRALSRAANCLPSDTPGGTFAIEASELHRVFPPPPPPDRVVERTEHPKHRCETARISPQSSAASGNSFWRRLPIYERG